VKICLRTCGALLAAVLASVLGAQPPAGSGCAGCHEQAKKLARSVHLSLTCEGCHSDHEKYPHPKGVERPACATCHSDQGEADARGVHGQARAKGNQGAPDCAICHGDVHEVLAASSPDFRKHVPETCGMCHTEISQQFQASVHGKAVARGVLVAPLCTDCHGEHSILAPSNAASPVSRGHIRETCARCHGDVRLSQKFGLPSDRILSFDTSFHGLAAKAGSQTVANCASCHGVHNILPSSDPQSTVNPSNLPTTCGKCHPGAGRRFSLGTIHSVNGGKEPPMVRYARQFYLFLIPLTIGLMLLHNAGDWFRKLYRLRLRPRPEPQAADPYGHTLLRYRDFRMYRFERVEHILLVLSFTVLVWTGFALKYPSEWWARPWMHWEHLWPVRGTVHRAAAAVMVAVTLMHVVSLIVSRRLRQHWLHLVPRAADVSEGSLHFLYNLGMLRQRPKLSAHGYIEKAEYWAVVWGTAVMILTGVMLWANSWTLRWLPKSWLDFATAVHFYEALLATLAILVWHFYTVIFDPEVYPMDTAWFSGYSVRRREPPEAQPPAEKPDSKSEQT
jgi:cytochrome b subunit of formate dehydrogenase